jgi:hypothetical protein
MGQLRGKCTYRTIKRRPVPSRFSQTGYRSAGGSCYKAPVVKKFIEPALAMK